MTPHDRDLDDELESHLRMAVDERVARGQSRDAAERAVRREFGNLTHVKEVTREMHGGLWLERLFQDVRYGWRALVRTPAFTIVAVLTLALGIGANSAVFTVVNGVLLRPLPFAHPDALYLASYLPTGIPFELPPGLTDRDYLSYRERARQLSPVAGYQRAQMTLTGAGDAERLTTAKAAADFFGVLGVLPSMGRPFMREEEQPGQDHVTVLSDRIWRDRYHADPVIVGKTIGLDGIPFTVVGVMPAGFDFPTGTALWTPLSIRLDKGNAFIFPVVGRLASGATPAQAREELLSIVRPAIVDTTAQQANVASIIPLKQQLTAKVETQLFMFTGAVSFVLLIACANVANLLLMRAATRRREVAVRVAIGASRTRIIRQLLTESMLVALIGGALGIVVAVLGVRALLLMAPPGRIPRLDAIHVDGWVLAFTFGVSLVTGIAFGLVPALKSAQREPREALSAGSRSVTGTHTRLRGAFVMAQIALALVLLAGAGLMIRSFMNMRAVDMGFDAGNVVTMAVDLPHASYPDAPRISAFHSAIVDGLSRVPGASAVGAVSYRPMGGMGIMGDFHIEGNSQATNGFNVDKPTIGPGYFRAMGIRLLAGRDFTQRDDQTAPGVVIVSASVARKVWSGSAVGKRVTMSEHPSPGDWLTVVGVVDDIVQDGELRKHSTIYFPYQQMKSLIYIDHMTYVVRWNAAMNDAPSAMRRVLRAVDPTVPAQSVTSMSRSMLENVAEPLFQTRLLTVFSLLALALAAIGTYGVLAYDVTERTHEIGLRMALGATPSEVVRVVMRRTIALAAPAIVLGTVGALALTRVLTKSLFEIRPNDPSTFTVVGAIIAFIALAAGLVPARKATRVDPIEALAAE